MEKVIVGLAENVTVFSRENATVLAKIDTGAESNSIDQALAEKIGVTLGDEKAFVKSALGRNVRPVVNLDIEIAGKRLRGRFTIADRSHLKYPVLIGKNILRQGFLVDPQQ